MGFFKKLLAGGLGWTLGGPIGAIIGVIIASISDNSESDYENRIGDGGGYGNESSAHRRGKAPANDFQIALLVLIASVMKADGKLLKSELDVVKQFLIANYGEDGALEALQILKRLLNQNIDTSQVAAQCGMNLSYSVRLQLLHMLYEVAAGDGDVDPSEVRTIAEIARYMRVSEADLSSIAAIFTKQTNKDWAYQMLEISPDCSDDEVKKAYRKMAMKYHPDKVNNLGEEVKKSATEKFRQVKEAYDAIKKQRGI